LAYGNAGSASQQAVAQAAELGGERRGPIRMDDELVLAGLAILAITLLYLTITALMGVPAAAGCPATDRSWLG
jgi:hypothetical protein